MGGAGGSLGDIGIRFAKRHANFPGLDGGKLACRTALASREPARPVQAGLDAHG